jgi:transposase
VVGVDEWAKCKGRTYGTIVVDLEHHTVIDLLDQHSSESVERWLSTHPEIHTICRDRNGRYGKAARKGAPAAKQVADRFHLVQNLRETIERELTLHRAYLRVKLSVHRISEHPPPSPAIVLPVSRPVTARERRLPPARRLATQTEISRQLRQNNQDLFDKFKALQASGLKISSIAQRLGFNRRRFDKWAKQSKLPERNKMQPAPGSAETFRQYLRQRWDAGYRNGRMLLDELRVLGYVGSYKSVGKVLSPWRFGNVAFESPANAGEPDLAILPPPPPNLTDPTQRQISPQIAASLLTKPRPELTASQAEIVDALKAGCPGYAAMRRLMMSFRAILKQSKLKASKKKREPRTVTALHRWLDRARASGIELIRNFAYQLRRDILAVEAAVTEKWSNGPVEGQVNRLKTIKRQMYGRAGVELLRARLIPLPVAPILLQQE